MDDVVVIPNLGVAGNNEPVPEVPVPSESNENGSGCARGHRSGRRRPPSRRAMRKAQAVNFLLYGLTLLIPGVAMIIVYFVVFRIPSGDVRWSPADAFVITGAILVGFSIVSEVIGLWQFCMSRYEPDEASESTTIENQQFSDAPPSYDGIAVDLPDLVVIASSHTTEENPPPSFESCYPNNRPLPGLENSTVDSVHTDDDDLPPPEYREIIDQKETQKRLSVIISQKTGNVKFVTSSEGKRGQTPPKDSS